MSAIPGLINPHFFSDSFHDLMGGPDAGNTTVGEEKPPGLPGTGGHVLSSEPK